MSAVLMLALIYMSFVTGVSWQMYKSHKKWEEETLPIIRENSRLKALLELKGIPLN